MLKNGAVTDAKLRNGPMTSARVRDRSSLAEDLRAGQLLAGPIAICAKVHGEADG